jgi:hypothetical protein
MVLGATLLSGANSCAQLGDSALASDNARIYFAVVDAAASATLVRGLIVR